MRLPSPLKIYSRKLLAGAITSFIVITFLLQIYPAFQKPALKPEQKIKLVEVENVVKKNLLQTVNLIGTIKPRHMASLTAFGTGNLEILVTSGKSVKKGTLLAKIINPELDYHLNLTAKAEKLAKSQYTRLKKLVPKGFASAREIEEKKQAWIQAQKELSKAKIEVDHLKFYAPFDGLVGAYKKREGALVSSGEPVMTIYDPSSLVVDLDIPCTNLPSVHQGSSAFILGKKYRLSHLQAMVDETTHMCPADIEISCQSCLIGSTVWVELIAAERKNTLVLPSQALVLKNSKPHVYVVNHDKLVLKPVLTGLQHQDKIEITQGLQPGTQVVIKGQDALYPGMKVKIAKSKTDLPEQTLS